MDLNSLPIALESNIVKLETKTSFEYLFQHFLKLVMREKSKFSASWMIKILIESSSLSSQSVRKAPLVLFVEEPLLPVLTQQSELTEINWSTEPREINCVTTWKNKYTDTLFTSTIVKIYQLKNGEKILYSLVDATARGWQIQDLNQHFLLLEGKLPESFGKKLPTLKRIVADIYLDIFTAQLQGMIEKNVSSLVIEQLIKIASQKIQAIEEKEQFIERVDKVIAQTKAIKLRRVKEAYCQNCSYFAGIENNKQYLYCAVHPSGSELELDTGTPTCSDHAPQS